MKIIEKAIQKILQVKSKSPAVRERIIRKELEFVYKIGVIHGRQEERDRIVDILGFWS